MIDMKKKIHFKPVELRDREWINNCLKESDYPGCEYAFTSIYIWKDIYHTRVAKVQDMFCVKFGLDGKYRYNVPAGSGDKKAVIQKLMEDAKECGHPFVLRGIMEEQIPQIEAWFPETFKFETSRDESDYIYTVEKLSTLAGKKLHGKRNHIHRFQDMGNWEYQEVDRHNIEECKKMNEEWFARYLTSEDKSLQEEAEAVKCALNNFEALGLKGGLLKQEGKVIAYTLAEPLNSNMYVIHIEKAFHDIQGAYPMMNQQFVLHNCQHYEYVNREEDTGDEGLRKAKLSYYPDILLDKYEATVIKEGEYGN